MLPTVRAIEVGYGYTKWVQAADGDAIKTRCFPSIAPVKGNKAIAEALGRKRETVVIPIDGIEYEVGEDARLAQGHFNGRNTDDDFCLTPEYLALTRGAMAYMGVEQIDLLVVGLPVSTFYSKRQALAARMEGAHELPGGRTLHVRRVLVLAQPHGALAAYGLTQKGLLATRTTRNLVIDCGSRTFDWLVTEGFKTLEQKSHAVNRGMIDVVESIAEGISHDIGQRYSDFDRIDRALRTGASLRVLGRTVNLSKHLKVAHRIAMDAVQELKRKVDAATDIDNIIIAGGGAFFFRSKIEEGFPRHQVRVLEDSMMANVLGFQTIGMEIESARMATNGAPVSRQPANVP